MNCSSGIKVPAAQFIIIPQSLRDSPLESKGPSTLLTHSLLLVEGGGTQCRRERKLPSQNTIYNIKENYYG